MNSIDRQSSRDVALPPISRRAFLVSVTVTGGALALGFGLDAAMAAIDEPELTAWVVIAPDDTVTIRVARSEMGQGAYTALPMLVAEELECDWDKVRYEIPSPDENLRRDRVWGDMSSGGSRSVRASETYLRQAGAMARTMLVAAAAKRWNVSPDECRVEKSVIHHASGKHLRFGEIAIDAARMPVPKDVALKDPKDWKILGTARKRLDIPGKVDGTARYAADVRFPGMLYAVLAQSPVFGGKLVSADESKILSLRGVRQVVKLDNAVAVVADSWWRAKTALDALPIVWDEGAGANTSDETILADLREGAAQTDLPATRVAGDADSAFKTARRVIEAEYHAPFLNHATMEPQNCTAHVTADGVEIWAPTQSAEESLLTAAKIAGITPDKVKLHKMTLGGGFGRRGVEQDYVVYAVKIAMQVNAPVKTLWSREEDMQHDCYRPVSVARLKAGVSNDGVLDAFEVRAALPSIAARYRPERLKGNMDEQSLDGFNEEFGYEIPNFAARNAMRPVLVPIGNWRSVNNTQNAFYKECFIDEVAHELGKDPVEFRRTLLRNAPKHLGVLNAAVAHAGWSDALPNGRFRGVAVHCAMGSYCAQVVEISLKDDGQPLVHRVVVAIDSGHAVNLETIEAQMEGGIVYGLTAALYGEITIAKGRATQTNFSDYEMLRMAQMPRIETLIVPSGDFWGGIGEPGVPPIAPALCNALFAATGVRVRSLPLKNYDLKTLAEKNTGEAKAASL